MKRGGAWVALFFGTVLLLSGCTSTDDSPRYVYGEATVTSLEIVITDSFPVQVVAIVCGELPDACTIIDSVSQELENRMFAVSLTTRRPVDEVCVLAVTPFEASIPLAVLGLEAGVYSVSVGGVSEIFRLAEDNVVKVRDPKEMI